MSTEKEKRNRKDNSELFKWDGNPSLGQNAAAGSTACAGSSRRLRNSSDFSSKCGKQCGRECKYGTFDTGFPCICRIVYLFTVIWKVKFI